MRYSVMNPRDYFPLGKAQGVAFCNRTEETEWLVSNIQAGKHILLMAPRRFGKSSLADHAITAAQQPWVCLNFNTCTNERDIEAVIRQGVSELIGKAIGPVEKVIHSIKQYVHRLTPKIEVGPQYARLELNGHPEESASTNIIEALELIEKLLQEKKRAAVMLLDEFQMVGIIAKGAGVEAAFRNVAQSTKRLTFVFSGSNRRLLKALFEDERRPLYKLCRKRSLNRIDASHYQTLLNRIAKLTWQKPPPPNVFDQIMFYSKRHPYYVNYLCDVLWMQCTQLPREQEVDVAWQTVVEEESSDAHAEIGRLSLQQKKILKYIAQYPSQLLLSAQALQAIGIAQSSLAGALTKLIEKDLVEKEEHRYIIINPVTEFLLKQSV